MDTCDERRMQVASQSYAKPFAGASSPSHGHVVLLAREPGGSLMTTGRKSMRRTRERDAHREKMFVCDVRNVQRGQRAAGPRRRSSLTEDFDQACDDLTAMRQAGRGTGGVGRRR